MSFQRALPPWLTQAVNDAGDATVILKPGDRPFVIRSKSPYHLGTQPMTTLTMEGLAQQILSEDAQQALDKGENVQETLGDDQTAVTVTAVKMDRDIVIKLRNENPKPPEVDEVAQQLEEETRIIKADVAAKLRAEAMKAAAAPAPAPEAPAAPARAPFKVENAGGETVADIELPVEEAAVDTMIMKLSTGPAETPAVPQPEEPAPAPVRTSAFARLTSMFSKDKDDSARREQEEAARREQEEAARRQAEEARRAQEEATRREQEEAARRAQEEAARREAEERAQRTREEAEAARRAQEEAAIREQEEIELRAQEAARREAEDRARRAQEEAEAARREQEETRRREQEEAVLRAQEEAARREQEEAVRLVEEEAARREAEERAQRAREEAEAARLAQEEAERCAREDAARREREDAARREREELVRREQEDAARRELEAKARQAQEEAAAARRELEDIARRAQEEAEAARRELAEVARRAQEEADRREQEELARRAEEDAARREREELARREQEDAARRELEEQTKRAREEAEAARRELADVVRRAQEDAARRAQEEPARHEQEERARREHEAFERREHEDAARRELEERAQRAREEAEAARRDLEEKARIARAEADAARRELAEVTRRAKEDAARRDREAAARFERERAARRAQEDAARREEEQAARRALNAARRQAIAELADADGTTEPAPARATVVDMSRRGPLAATTELTDWILEAMDQGATALYLRAGKAPFARIDGQVEILSAEAIPLSLFERAGAAMSAGEDGWQPAGEWAWTKHIPGTGSVHCQTFTDGQGGGFIVQLPVAVTALDEQVPRHIRNACDTGEGLVLISAPFAEDVAAMVGAVVAWNARRRAGHIVSFGTSGSLERVAGSAFISDRPLPSDDYAMTTALQGAMRERSDMLVVLASGPLPAVDALISAAVGRLVVVGVVARTAPRALEALMSGLGSSRHMLAANFKAACRRPRVS
jgi:hypothetical protein